jgi:catechol 2,3-dioxygenase-like lactoylglutathione lyase family enzyme
MIKINESNVTIMVADINKAIAFYESIGLKLKARWDDHYAMVEAPGVTIGLHPGEGNLKASEKISIGFMVSEADEAEALLKKNGIKFDRNDEADSSGIYLHFQDPDGTTLYFTQPKWRY